MALLFESETYAISGACFEVYREQGCGFLESVYQECLEMEFRWRGIPFTPQPQLNVTYKGQVLRQRYQADFVCYGQIVIELKAVSNLCDQYRAQLHNYLKTTGYRLGLLVNFGHFPKLEHERVIR